MYRGFSQSSQVSGMEVKRPMQNTLQSNVLGVISSWGGSEAEEGESQMERNSVAKPLVLIETAIFFFLHQNLDGASRSLAELTAGNTRDIVMSGGCPS